MARTTPAQKPRGRNKIIFFPVADIGVVDIGYRHYNNSAAGSVPALAVNKPSWPGWLSRRFASQFFEDIVFPFFSYLRAGSLLLPFFQALHSELDAGPESRKN
jgi:hypothetical protein